MKTEDLILCLRDVSPKFLEESEKIPCKKKNTFLRITLIAASLCVLAIMSTAMGARHIFGIEIRQTRNAAILPEGTVNASGDVYADIKLIKNAPSSLEEHYLPVLPQDQWIITKCSANRFSSIFTSENGTDHVTFQQLADPNYDGQSPLDDIDLGYDALYEIKEDSFCDISVLAVTVKPSQAHGDPGRHKYYWSDGRYIFILEINYDMEPSVLEAVFDSIVPVEIEQYWHEPQETISPPVNKQEIESPMYPTLLPHDWGKESGGLQPDGSYSYFWHPLWEVQTMTVLNFIQTMDESYYEDVKTDWITRTDPFSYREEAGIHIYEAQNQVQILWQKDTCFFSLDSAGENHLSVEELLAIAKSVQ